MSKGNQFYVEWRLSHQNNLTSKKLTDRSGLNNRISKCPSANVPIRPRLKVTCGYVLMSGQ